MYWKKKNQASTYPYNHQKGPRSTENFLTTGRRVRPITNTT